MRLLVHNFLCCIKCDSYPLEIKATKKKKETKEFNKEFIENYLKK